MSGNSLRARQLKKKISKLKGSLSALESMEVVLTVVGAMKAGKSTCINAIVGREILPSRNRPMTLIPTLIRHKAGCCNPTLYFYSVHTIQRHVGKLRTALTRLSIVRGKLIDGDTDLKKLTARIRRGLVLKEIYKGEADIHSFLQILNDLGRLSSILKIDFPIEHFSDLENIPFIEVEFSDLSQRSVLGQRGSIALLDTPGFNEADQSSHLKKIVSDQLQCANAVLVILDYTQLKSESEAFLIEELKEISRSVEGRIFALVNKFDSQNHRSDNSAQTIQYVAEVLLNGVVPESAIFPVCATRALLVQRARHELQLRKSLNWKEGRKQDWRDDFGQLAFGSDYSRFMNDSELVDKAMSVLWDSCKFDRPLQDIVVNSQVSAVKFVVDSAIDQLHSIVDLLDGSEELRIVKGQYLSGE